MLIGIVGKPSCGKSTFFKAATLSEVEIANYPFTTIKPNHAVGFVRIDCVDKFFEKQCNPRTGYCINHQRFVPVDIIDVAGLVPGAHKGEGMGSQFLSDLNQADALIHVIDISGSVNEKGEPVGALGYDPLKDVEFLEDELNFWYLDILKKGWEKLARSMQQTKEDIPKVLGKQLSGVGVDEDMVKEVLAKLRLSNTPISWTEDELLKLSTELRIRSKPMMIAANKVDVPGASENLKKLKEKYPNYIVVGCSAESELALKEAGKHEMIDYIPGDDHFKIKDESKLNEQQLKGLNFISEFVKQNNGTGVQNVLNETVFKLLNMMCIFPGGVNKLSDQHGNVLPDCFMLKEGSTALDFAYKVHTDFGKNFIRAIDVKTKQTVGREHVLKHLDVVEIISGK